MTTLEIILLVLLIIVTALYFVSNLDKNSSFIKNVKDGIKKTIINVKGFYLELKK